VEIYFSVSFWVILDCPISHYLILILSDTHLVIEVLGDQLYWKGLPSIVGSWIGGSTSQLVLKKLVECPENIFLNILIIDNIIVNIWTILMFQGIERSDRINQLLKIDDHSRPDPIAESSQKTFSPAISFGILLAIILLVNVVVESFTIKIILLSFIGLLLSTLIKKWPFKFVLKLSGILIIMVMAILGLKLKFDLIHLQWSFIVFLIVWLVSHFMFMMIVAKILNISTVWVHISSMANVGGIATAPVVTAAYDKQWMPHTIVLAILCMATGTFWVMLTIYLLQQLF